MSVYGFSDTGFRQILGLLLHGGLHPKIGNVPSQTAPSRRRGHRSRLPAFRAVNDNSEPGGFGSTGKVPSKQLSGIDFYANEK